MKKRTEFIIEIEREIIINNPGNGGQGCPICGEQVQMLRAHEAGHMMKISESVVYRLAETGQLHFTASSEGMLLICPVSLAEVVNDDHGMSSQQLLITEGQVLPASPQK